MNVVDAPELCDAFTPSLVDRDLVVAAIGTEGTAPVLARQIKTRIEESLEPNLGDLAALAGRQRWPPFPGQFRGAAKLAC
jgi:uroporphyrin-III C-methyltransferase/precorrin-2 dehydrogenase/sirohydrochlorin ferrochelatase